MTDSAQHATNAAALLNGATDTLEKTSGFSSDVVLGTTSVITARAQVEATLSVAAAIREQTAAFNEINKTPVYDNKPRLRPSSCVVPSD